MPHLLSADHGESSRSRSRQRARTEVSEHRSMWNRLSFQKIGSWLKREEDEPPPLLAPTDKPGQHDEEGNKENGRPHSSGEHGLRAGGFMHRRSNSKKVIPGLPRPATFKRMNSEKRDKLLEVPPQDEQRRTESADRRRGTITRRHLSVPPTSVPSSSAPDVLSPYSSHNQEQEDPLPTIGGKPDSNIPAGARQVDYDTEDDYMLPEKAPSIDETSDMHSEHGSHRSDPDIDQERLKEELEAKWILNLSMHFRDMSDREKFFITYAEEPNKWRRVTVSCDYRKLEPDSLESDLKTLHYQRDKSSRIYEAIRDSLPDIQFYDTVTNLKLQTSDGRLHVHVTEDVNEIIPYPPVSAIEHLPCRRFREDTVLFDSHISGFVYKVSVNNLHYIKKEIPGPDAVEEFLYEINALCSLQDSNSVIRFEGIIVDDSNSLIKGLLISYAKNGALVDVIYDEKPSGELTWPRRERWARQIVEGLSEIHEAGFVQGDFTLSNIVIDEFDNAKIIDINRRGCPVGWEPPELARLIESGQRISIYIGVKSDLYQLGMVLWALAELEDEPERQDRPLVHNFRDHEVPTWFKDIISDCLSESPRWRPSAAKLLQRFDGPHPEQEATTKIPSRESVSTHRSDKEYIDPKTAVDLEDISQHRRHSRTKSSFEKIDAPESEYPPSSGSYIISNRDAMRGRSPGPATRNSDHRQSDCSPGQGHRSVMSLDDSELEHELASLPASRETRWEQIYVDGDTKLVQRGCTDVHDFATQDPKDICITTPPEDMEKSFQSSNTSHNTPRNLSTSHDLRPIEPPQFQPSSFLEAHDKSPVRRIGTKASFSDRVHQMAQSQTQHGDGDDSTYHSKSRPHSQIPDSAALADLENELDMYSSVPSSAAPSRADTGFSMSDRSFASHRVDTGFSIATGHRFPLHQDSGFAEPERRSYESERIRQSLEERERDLRASQDANDKIRGSLWDEKDGNWFGEGVKGHQLQMQPVQPVYSGPVVPISSKTDAVPYFKVKKPSAEALRIPSDVGKALEERTSNTTIRAPSIQLPDFQHGIPKQLAESNTPANPRDLHPTSSPAPSNDLSDYLSHSISYDHTTDYYTEQPSTRGNSPSPQPRHGSQHPHEPVKSSGH